MWGKVKKKNRINKRKNQTVPIYNIILIFFKLFFIAAGFCDRSLRTWKPETAGSQMKEKKFVSLSAKLLFQNPGLNFSFIFRCTVVDQRQAPCTPIEAWHSPLTTGIHLLRKRLLFLYYSMDGHNECDIWVYINGYPWHWGCSVTI